VKLVVLGATGLLGTTLVPRLRQDGLEVLSQSRRAGADLCFDPADRGALLEALAPLRPDWVVNLAGLTDVDACQRDPDAAFRANTRVNQNLAALLAESRAAWVLALSTDHVYDSPAASREDEVVLRNIYAYSKLAGELALGSERAVALRTNFFGPSRCARPSFSDWVIERWTRHGQIRIFTDIFFSPLHMDTLCEAVATVLRRPQPGVYNLGSSSGLSKAEFALQLARTLRLPPIPYEAVSQDTMPLAAPRPKNMTMDSSKWQAAFGVRLPTLEEEIHKLGTSR